MDISTKEIIDAIEGEEGFSDEDAHAIIKALAEKVEPPAPVRLTKPNGRAVGRIHTHISSVSSDDAWLCHLWLRDAADALGHIPVPLAELRETYAHHIGVGFFERAIEKAGADALAGRERGADGPGWRAGLEEEPPQPDDPSKGT